MLDESTLTSEAVQGKLSSLIQSLKKKTKNSAKITVALLESSVKLAMKQPEERSAKVEKIIQLLHELREQFVVSFITNFFKKATCPLFPINHFFKKKNLLVG